jgi:hypothetical protein
MWAGATGLLDLDSVRGNLPTFRHRTLGATLELVVKRKVTIINTAFIFHWAKPSNLELA